MIQGYRDTENIDIDWIQLGIQRYSNKGIREYKGHSNIGIQVNDWIQEYRDTWIRLDTRIQGYRNTGIQRYRRQRYRAGYGGSEMQ